jgi:hypothetical protein
MVPGPHWQLHEPANAKSKHPQPNPNGGKPDTEEVPISFGKSNPDRDQNGNNTVQCPSPMT